MDSSSLQQNITKIDYKEKSWKRLVKESLTKAEEIAELTNQPVELIEKVVKVFPARINPYYFSLIESENDPIWRQCIPDIKELSPIGFVDPLNEEACKHGCVVHRYPTKCLFLASNQCASYCRFCTRKRRVGDLKKKITKEEIKEGIDYIKSNKQIKDVLISGGDPLMLSTQKLKKLIEKLIEIEHVSILRVGSRVPCTLPQRIIQDKRLQRMFEEFSQIKPIYLNTHFNHPREITEEAKKACFALANAGIPLGNQSVLLKGVNDDYNTMLELNEKLLTIKVKPYYVYFPDLVIGTEHFRVRVEKGMEIINKMRGRTTGFAIPTLVIDAPGGLGKTPVIKDNILSINDKEVVMRSYSGKIFSYPQPLEVS
ncbi:MAG: KamA family radical SAM protein [Candidatus Aenigmarchaeota archaeon]|nr:KamA family radical SAM protein [Candidatus Aenigmarchaeota archaeon]MCX8179686.1 KamA family radical SAM protein [Candidatus Aenigmarchaeota archaeon]